MAKKFSDNFEQKQVLRLLADDQSLILRDLINSMRLEALQHEFTLKERNKMICVEFKGEVNVHIGKYYRMLIAGKLEFLPNLDDTYTAVLHYGLNTEWRKK